MAPRPADKVHKPSVEMEKAPIPSKTRKSYCILCRKLYLKHEAHKHMHSMLHHRELEIVLGRDSFHQCQACKVSAMGLNEYAKHISTAQHNAKLKKLMLKDCIKPVSLRETVDPEALAKIQERCKNHTKAMKKAKKKQKKKNKQQAAQTKNTHTVSAQKRKKESNRADVNTSKQPAQLPQKGSSKVLAQNKENRLAGRLEWQHSRESTTQRDRGARQTVWSREQQVQHPHVQTLSNEPAHLQGDDPVQSDRPDFKKQYSKGKDVDCQAERFNQISWNTREDGADAAEQSSLSNVNEYEEDFTSDELPFHGAIYFNTQEESKTSSSQQDPGPSLCSSSAPAMKSAERSSSDVGSIRDVDVNMMLREIRRALGVREPCRADREARKRRTEAGVQSEAHSSGAQAGGKKEGPSSTSSRDRRTEFITSPHVSKANVDKGPVDKSAKTPSLQSQEASTTVPTPPKQRALRKATEKTPRSEVSSRAVAHQDTAHQDTRPNGKERGECLARKSAKSPSLQPLQAVPKRTKELKLKKKLIKAEHSEESSEVACHSDAQERDQQGGGSTVPRLGTLPLPASLSRHVGKTASAEPNLNAARRIRNVGESRKVEGDKEGDKAKLKPTIQKLLCSAGSQRKVNWSEMYQEAHRKKQEKVKGMPRFGIELVNPLTDQEGLTQLEEADLPLSEGFQWECDLPFSEGHPPPPPPEPPRPHHPPARTSPANDSITESRSESRTRDTEQPRATTPGGDRSSQTVAVVAVKMEAYSEEDQFGCSEGNYSSGSNTRRKEKRKADGDMTGKKKTKSKNEQTQVDQLLSVSLKEEELNRSMQDVDTSLIQARNALQAAYTEVQRLLLLKQQFTTEVNYLRAQRIEILQGMQGGYAGASSVGEHDGAVPTEATVTVPQRPASLPLSGPHAASVNHPHPTSSARTNVSIKQERYECYTEEPARQLTKEVLPAEAAHQSPGNQGLHLDPATVPQPTSLPRRSKSVSPAVSTTVVAESSISAPPISHSTKKQVKQEMRERSKDRRMSESSETQRRVRLEDEKRQQTASDSEEEHPARRSKGRELTGDGVAPSVAPEKARGQPAVVQDTGEEDDSDSDGSLKMVEPSAESNLEIIDLEDSDSESVSDAVSNVSARPGPSQKTAGVEVTFETTQTSKSKGDKTASKTEVPSASMKNTTIPPESAEDEEPSSGTFQSHTGPVHGLQVHGGLLYTCSGDNTARAYSLETRELQAVFEGHTSHVNCLLASSPPNLPPRLYTGSSDQTVLCYSIKTKKCLEKILLPDRVLCMYIGWNILYVGLTNGSVVSFDIKNLKQLDVFECHGSRAVSCLATAQEGARRVLLVGSFDSTISVRDAKSGLLLRTLTGHTQTVLCMKVVNDLVFSGSSDTSVHAHNIHTGELVRIYKGHCHAVTAVAILGKVMVTACVDKLVRVYELQSHDRLQVYGGHSDMVLCMAIHKSMIYTGCVDGTVKAVKLNLMTNHRCWWHGCTLIFGMVEHLRQHLLKDHSNPNQQTAKCRWRGCDAFFATRDALRLEMPEHMQNHAENDSRLES